MQSRTPSTIITTATEERLTSEQHGVSIWLRSYFYELQCNWILSVEHTLTIFFLLLFLVGVADETGWDDQTRLLYPLYYQPIAGFHSKLAIKSGTKLSIMHWLPLHLTPTRHRTGAKPKCWLPPFLGSIVGQDTRHLSTNISPTSGSRGLGNTDSVRVQFIFFVPYMAWSS